MTKTNKEQLNSFINELFRRRNKTVKNHKAYDRARDRKDKKLYEYENDTEENNDGRSENCSISTTS